LIECGVFNIKKKKKGKNILTIEGAGRAQHGEGVSG
jgi:hypothetical protein